MIMRICSWCNTVLELGDGNEENATHTICPDCHKEWNRKRDEEVVKRGETDTK